MCLKNNPKITIMKRSNLVLSIAACLLLAATVFQSCKKDGDDYTTDCNDLDYSGCIECKVTYTADSSETTSICRVDYNSTEDFKAETCAGLAYFNGIGFTAKCRNQD